MAELFHPAPEAISLTAVLAAIGEPTRLAIVKRLDQADCGINCGQAAPCPDLAKSTMSNHFRVLREAGVIRMVKRGVENINTLRREDLDSRFPGLLDHILRVAD
ncbi:ArsR/SmtB family transcription factor [Jiella sonneratiae]|uniref:Helix-turn-helix transcriptional regulator n=1 Tax=Jiella sonneratiae TaxID=2816856 RepID=A0ABS3J756_9HYPH|nr:helix-turn-helix domain-containing protein [Jiella sonneratiae]MBO0905491.1 helix-turn-helix transcriptional regulator [Jiella sonneratiae]